VVITLIYYPLSVTPKGEIDGRKTSALKGNRVGVSGAADRADWVQTQLTHEGRMLFLP